MHNSYNLQKGVCLSHNFSEESKILCSQFSWCFGSFRSGFSVLVCVSAGFSRTLLRRGFSFLSSGAFSDPTNIFPSYLEFLVLICASLIHSVFTFCNSSNEVLRSDSSISFMCSSAEKIGVQTYTSSSPQHSVKKIKYIHSIFLF